MGRQIKRWVAGMLAIVMMAGLSGGIVPARTKAAADANGFTIKDNVLVSYTGSDENVMIPEGVTEIGETAFVNCSKVKTITIPSTVTTIREFAFTEVRALESIQVAGTNASFQSKDGSLLSKDGTVLYRACPKQTTYEIPAGVISMKRDAFESETVEKVVIPASFTTYKRDDFYSVPKLTTIEVAAGNTAFIGENGYLMSTDKKTLYFVTREKATITIPTTIKNIRGKALADNNNVESIVIPDTVTSISDFMCSRCTKLKSVILPKNLTQIGYSAFQGCTSLESIVIPSKVLSIGAYSFYRCESLKSVSLSKELKTINSSAFAGCDSLQNITLPNGLKNIGDSAFYGCNSLVKVKVPANVKSLCMLTFGFCSKLEEVELPKGMDIIRELAFNGCVRLKRVIMPENLIPQSLFRNTFLNVPETTEYTVVKGSRIATDMKSLGIKGTFKEVARPRKGTVKSAKRVKAKKIKVTLKKQSVTGYEISYARNKKFTKSTKTITVKSTAKVLTKLKKKTYYIRVRGYKTYGTQRLYGAWSKSKKVK